LLRGDNDLEAVVVRQIMIGATEPHDTESGGIESLCFEKVAGFIGTQLGG
jgi:hypothetical protein